jgi:4-methylaminobutanoate oxidase (formaldehyde-forming)
VPTEFTAGVYDDLMRAGAPHGIRDAGYYALEGLRLEKGFRAWSRELTPDVTPMLAGLSFAVDMDKPGGFIGRDALLAAKADPDHLCTRIVQLVLEDNAPQLWGGEAVLMDGNEIGEVRSAAYGHSLGASAALCLLHASQPLTRAVLEAARFEVDLAGEKLSAIVHLRSPYDPAGMRPKVDA